MAALEITSSNFQGEVVEQSVGAKPKDRLVRELNLESHATTAAA